MSADPEVRQGTPRFFPPVSELVRDRGWIGQALSTVPEWLLKEADHWAEWNWECQKKRRDPNRFPLPDPWRFLMDAPAVPAQIKNLCRAAQSQLAALRRLVRLAEGVATLKTDWHQEALNARHDGDAQRFAHAANKLANALSMYTPVRADVEKQAADRPGLLDDSEKWLKRRRAELVHRGARAEADSTKPLPKWSEVQRRFPFESLLAVRWVRLVSNGPPGFMFWRNEALTGFLFGLQRRSRPLLGNLGLDYAKKVRQRLGLILVTRAAPRVWEASAQTTRGGRWMIKGSQRDQTTAFSGFLSSL